jgi:serine/threonine protein kinase
MAVGGATEPSVGTVLASKYRITGKLGAGGMATVFSAENTVTHKRVALKWLHPEMSSAPDVSARLLREAQATSRLRHPNVVDVYDLVQDGSQMFMVMELLEGETLRAYLKRAPRPTVSEFIALLLPALEGVAAAHDCGVIHRDLKPDNIFLARMPDANTIQVKVLDFGVAKLADTPGLALTRTGTTLGTPLYMSLEQLRGDKQITERTDVYAFGVMLYEALSGRHPYDAITLSELAIKVATIPAPPLKSLCPELPSSLARVVDWAIAKQPSGRLPSVRALIRELEPFSHERSLRDELTNRDLSLPRLASYSPLADDLSLLRPIAAASTGTDTFASRGRRYAWFASGITLICGVLLVGWLSTRSEPAARTRLNPPLADAPLESSVAVAAATQSRAPTLTSLDDVDTHTPVPRTEVQPPVQPLVAAMPSQSQSRGSTKSKRRTRTSADEERLAGSPRNLTKLESRKSAAELLGF